MILTSQNGDYLGETHILYKDEEAEKMQQQEKMREQVEKEVKQRLVQKPELLIDLLKESISCLGGNSEKGIGR